MRRGKAIIILEQLLYIGVVPNSELDHFSELLIGRRESALLLYNRQAGEGSTLCPEWVLDGNSISYPTGKFSMALWA